MRPYLPPEVFDGIKAEGVFVDELHILACRLKRRHFFYSMDDILAWGRKELKIFLNAQKDISVSERRRFDLLVQMYRLVHQKYNLSFRSLKGVVPGRQGRVSGMAELMEVLETENRKLSQGLLTSLERLKSSFFPRKLQCHEHSS